MIKVIHKIPLIKLDTIPNICCTLLAHISSHIKSSTHTKATQSYDTPSSKASSSPPPQRTPTPTPTSPVRSSRASWPSSPCGSPPPGSPSRLHRRRTASLCRRRWSPVARISSRAPSCEVSVEIFWYKPKLIRLLLRLTVFPTVGTVCCARDMP